MFTIERGIKYIKKKLIDYGTYGKVFEMMKMKIKKCACKEIEIYYSNNSLKKEFISEVRFLSYIFHPNLIFLQNFLYSKNEDSISLIMDFCELNLRNLIENKIKISTNQILFIGLQILNSIVYLHLNKIIHRDLKSSNILINRLGIVKICDFGMGTFLCSKKICLSDKIITLWYRAPEILLGQHFYDFSVDMWSFGCVIGELITGEILFQGKSELDQLNKIFQTIGTPTTEIWLNLHTLKFTKNIVFPIQPYNKLNLKLESKTNKNLIFLLQKILVYDPKKRLRSTEALKFFYSFF